MSADFSDWMFASLVRNPGGRTPQTTQSDTPNPDRTMEIDSLVQSATRGRSQTALKRLVCIGLLLTAPLKCCLGP